MAPCAETLEMVDSLFLCLTVAMASNRRSEAMGATHHVASVKPKSITHLATLGEVEDERRFAGRHWERAERNTRTLADRAGLTYSFVVVARHPAEAWLKRDAPDQTAASRPPVSSGTYPRSYSHRSASPTDAMYPERYPSLAITARRSSGIPIDRRSRVSSKSAVTTARDPSRAQFS